MSLQMALVFTEETNGSITCSLRPPGGGVPLLVATLCGKLAIRPGVTDAFEKLITDALVDDLREAAERWGAKVEKIELEG